MTLPLLPKLPADARTPWDCGPRRFAREIDAVADFLSRNPSVPLVKPLHEVPA